MSNSFDWIKWCSNRKHGVFTSTCYWLRDNQYEKGYQLKIILLPGLDGTGLLFRELLTYIPYKIECTVISLDNLEGDTF